MDSCSGSPPVRRIMKAIRLLIDFALIVAALAASTAHAENRPIRVGLYQNQPKVFMNENGLPDGLFVDLLDSIALREGWTVEYVVGEWDVCMRRLVAGEIDLMPDVAYSAERDLQYDFHDTPVTLLWSRLYAPAASSIKNLPDLDGKRIAVLRGSIQERVFEQLMNGFGYSVSLVPASSFEEAFALTAGGEADAAVANHLFGDCFYRNYGLVKTGIEFNRVELFYATAESRNRDLLAAIDRHLNQWIEQPNSPYFRVLAKWTEKKRYSLPSYIGWTIAGILVLLIGAAGMILLLRHQVRLRTRHLERANVALRESDDRHRRQAERLAALRTIDQAITASVDSQATLRILLKQVVEQLKVDAAGMLSYDPRLQILAYAAGHGFRTGGYERSRMKLGEGIAGRAALERRLLMVDDVLASPDALRKEMLIDEGFVSRVVVPFVAKDELKGVLEIFHRERLAPNAEWIEFLETLAGQAAIAIDSAQLFEDLQRSAAELQQAYDATIEGWSRALDLRDRETEGHTQRVLEMTVKMARAAGIAEEEIVHVRRGALLHDIGKMGVPDRILNKPDKLSDDEWEIMRRHPGLAYEMLNPIAYLHPALDIPYCHHEKWDGTGYPRGLKSDEIPLAARLFAVVDVWDALMSDRPYRRSWPEEQVFEYIRSQSGKHFDPRAVDVFFACLDHPTKGRQ